MENTVLHHKFHPLQSTNVSATTKLLMTDNDSALNWCTWGFCNILVHILPLSITAGTWQEKTSCCSCNYAHCAVKCVEWTSIYTWYRCSYPGALMQHL